MLSTRSHHRCQQRHTFIADSISGHDCATEAGTAVLNLLFNMIKDGSCIPAAMHDPRLGPLQNNGGPNLTYSLLPGSPAIDHNPTCTNARSSDQRGVSRPQGAGCDVGALEIQPIIYIPMMVSNTLP